MPVHQNEAGNSFQNLQHFADVVAYTLRRALTEVCGIDATNKGNFSAHHFRKLALIRQVADPYISINFDIIHPIFEKVVGLAAIVGHDFEPLAVNVAGKLFQGRKSEFLHMSW